MFLCRDSWTETRTSQFGTSSCQTCLFHNLLYAQRVLIAHSGLCYTAQGSSPLCHWPLQVYFPGCWTNRDSLEGKFSHKPAAAMIYVIQKAKGTEQKLFFPYYRLGIKTWGMRTKHECNDTKSLRIKELTRSVAPRWVGRLGQKKKKNQSFPCHTSASGIQKSLFKYTQKQLPVCFGPSLPCLPNTGGSWEEIIPNTLSLSPPFRLCEDPAMGICCSHRVRRQLQNALKTLFGRKAHDGFDFNQ